MDPIFITLVVGFGLAALLFGLALVVDSWALGFAALITVLATLIVLLVIDNHKYNNAVEQVERTCFPNVVTHLAQEDGKLIFDCANDGKLRTVKIR